MHNGECANCSRLAAYEKAAKAAIESSIPYVAKYDAFLISAEAWNMLAVLVVPGMVKLNELLDRARRGEKISAEEVHECFTGGSLK